MSLNIPQTFGCLDAPEILRSHITSFRNSVGELPEDSTAAWASGANYAAGDERHRVETGMVYTATAAITASAVPPEQDAAKWNATRPTNRMAAFDLYRHTRTSGDSQLILTLRPDAFVDMVYLAGVTGASATVSVTDGPAGPVVQPLTTIPLDSYGVHDWQAVFLAPVLLQEYALFTGIELCADPVITITINNPGSTAKLGKVLAGRFLSLGWAEYGVSFRVQNNDYTKFFPDGTYEYRERPPSAHVSGRVFIDPKDFQAVGTYIEMYRSRPTLWAMHTGEGFDLLRHVAKFSGELTRDSFGRASLNATMEGMP